MKYLLRKVVMNNKTVVFDAQREIAELKRRVEYLEKLDPTYGKAVTYASGLAYVPTDGYTTKLHDCSHHNVFNVSDMVEMRTNTELLDTLKQVAKDFKENKLD